MTKTVSLESCLFINSYVKRTLTQFDAKEIRMFLLIK